MIIDNADDAEVFASTSTRARDDQDALASRMAPSLLDFIPQSSNGSVLVTSRNRDVAFKLTGAYTDIIQVDPMGQRDALSLLQNQLKGGYGRDATKQKDATKLVAELDYMPLAITQAAAYINQRAPRTTVSSYLRDIRKGSQNMTKLLQTDLGDTRRDGTASNSILSTWQLSFEHIRKERPSTTRLLSLMSCFNRQGIPDSLLDGSYSEFSDDNDNFEDDLSTLMAYSLVAADTDERHFQMHRLVQFSTIKWLELYGDLDYWKEKYLILLDKHYPLEAEQELSVHEALFPHAQAAVAYQPTTQEAQESWKTLLNRAISYASSSGFCQVAIEMGQHALETSESTLGMEHPDTLYIAGLVGAAFHSIGNDKGAELMYRRVITGYKNSSWQENSFFLDTSANLALALSRQRSYEEAEAIYRLVLQKKENLLGPEAESTLSTMDNLGVLLLETYRYEEAVIMFERTLRVRKEVVGPQHADTLRTLRWLGVIYKQQGELTDAETLLRHALEYDMDRVGEKHPDTLACMQQLSSVLSAMGKQDEAEIISRRGLEFSIAALGEGHRMTLGGFNQLGLILSCQGKYEEAEALHRNALTKAKEVFGEENRVALNSMFNLAKTLWRLDRKGEAVLLMKQYYSLRKRTLGPSHKYTRAALRRLREWEKAMNRQLGM